jgi:hypothetical protein
MVSESRKPCSGKFILQIPTSDGPLAVSIEVRPARGHDDPVALSDHSPEPKLSSLDDGVANQNGPRIQPDDANAMT